MEVNPKRSGHRATIKGIAAELGVSASTVSNAYNRPDQLSPALRERVFETARRLGYGGPDPAARSLRSRRAGAIGVLYADRLSYAFADPAAVMFMQGVSVATEEAGLGMLLVPGSPRQARDPEVVGSAVVDGFIVYCLAEEDPLSNAALGRRLPTVLVDQPPQKGLPAVGIDDEGSARTVAEHFLGLGHTKFGVISFELAPDVRSGLADQKRQRSATYWPSRRRLGGYASALEEAGIAWEDVPVYECAENHPEEGRQATETLLALEQRPTAILALSDQLALGAIKAITQKGLSVPKDISVAGFDDIPEAARSNPRLTTVRQPHVEKGIKAGRMLIDQLQGDDAPRSKVLPSRLVVRGSTGPA
ncbi:MAG: LacI family DNA-binding transcriptional regulator [Rubrobacteraceae bacterium]